MEDYEDNGGAIDQSPYPGLRSGYLFSGNGTNADYEGRLHALKIRNAIDEEQAKSDKLYNDSHPDAIDLELAGQKKKTEYERSLPAGSQSRMHAEVSDPGAISRISKDPSMAGWASGNERSNGMAIDRDLPMGSSFTGAEEAGMAITRNNRGPTPVDVEHAKTSGRIASEQAPVEDADTLIAQKYGYQRRKEQIEGDATVDPARKAQALARLEQAIAQLDERLGLRKENITHKAPAFDFGGGTSTVNPRD